MSKSNEKTAEFFEQAERLSREYSSRWEKERISSRRIVKEAKAAVEKSAESVEAFAYFFALQRRVDRRYATFFKAFFFYFAMRRETALLLSIRSKLKLPRSMQAERAVGEETGRKKNGKENGGEETDGAGERREKEKKPGEKETESASARKSELSETKAEAPVIEEKEEKEPEAEKKKEPTEKKGTAEKGKEGSEIKKSEKTSDSPKQTLGAEERVGREENPAPQTPLETEQEKPSAIPYRFESDVLSDVFKQNVPPRESTSNRPPDYYERPRTGIRSGDVAGGTFREPVPPDEAQGAVKNFPNVSEREKAAEKEDLPTEKTVFSKAPLPAESAKAETSEENLERIRARDAFAKMSDEELETIRQAMQESLNREMAEAEARGEIYKLPIVVKEAIEKGSAVSEKPAERSSADPVVKK